MEILNSTIPIHCDGLYLFFLKGDITLEKANDSLTLKVHHQPTRSLLEVTCREKETKLQEVVVSELRSNDKVYMEADHDRLKKSDLLLGLIMLNPRSFCSPKN
ncbi:tumor necrosis factor ligand superfamily member 4 [Tiliqua scincoides]|uniref:tumor necrosis factor ligand superfamily member 4 n=1 Tax=Tiliqua scincoides TaxID=71010 RepID=UPI00346278EF